MVAKTASLPKVSIEDLTSDFAVTDFASHLETALKSISRKPSALIRMISKEAGFPVYKRVVCELPPIGSIHLDSERDVLFASNGSPQRIAATGIKRAIPAKFSTALVKKAQVAGPPAVNPLAGVFNRTCTCCVMLIALPTSKTLLWCKFS